MSKFSKKILMSILTLLTLFGNFWHPSISLGAQNVRTNTFSTDMDVARDWTIADYTSTLNAPLEDIFKENHVAPYDATMVSIGFVNIGSSQFKATKTLPLKAGVTYKINLGYSLFIQNMQPTGPHATASIDFNGTTIHATGTPLIFGKENGANNMYYEEITPTHDMDYLITLEYSTPKYEGVSIALGYYNNEIGSGVNALFNLSYDANGATSGTLPIDNNTYVQNESITLPPANDLAKTNYTFAGWNTTANGVGTTYQPGDIFTITGNTVLYAQWNPINSVNFVVNYDGNTADTGDVVDPQNPYIANDNVTIMPNTFVKDQHTFTNWNTMADGTGTTYQPGDVFTITENTVLYAQWDEDPFADTANTLVQTGTATDMLLLFGGTLLLTSILGCALIAKKKIECPNN